MICGKCGQQAEPQRFCPHCGASLLKELIPEVSVGTAERRSGRAQMRYQWRRSRIVAGVLALFLGRFGIHKFYLGYNKQGIIMLLGSLIGGWRSLGWLTGALYLIGIVEALIYLVKSDEKFESIHSNRGRPWF